MTDVAAFPTASSWPGLEKFNIVQDYLEKNKWVTDHYREVVASFCVLPER